MEGHTDTVNSVCFSPDGKTIASGFCDNTFRCWDVKDGGLIAITVSLPGGEWATYNRQKLLALSPGAHKYLGYSIGLARIPVEAFN